MFNANAERKSQLTSKKRLVDFESARRSAFTKNWDSNVESIYALPIKVAGKVVPVTRTIDTSISHEEEEGENECDAENLEAIDAVIEDDGSQEFEFQDEKAFEREAEFVANERKKKTSLINVSETVAQVLLSEAKLNREKKKIADICTSVMANPEGALKKKKADAVGSDPDEVSLKDLFGFFKHSDDRIAELAMLSAALVFKDILPSYRIRPKGEVAESSTLKKETKRVQDFETALLSAYHIYLKSLDGCVQAGLGNPRKEVSTWGISERLGLVALHCQVELLKALPHFNFRGVLLNSIATRGSQQTKEIHGSACEALHYVFSKDNDGELSLEGVKIISKVMQVSKFDVPEALIRCLEAVKVRVRADDAKEIHRKAKQERRKRKRAGDDVDAGLLEAEGINKTSVQKQQANALHELCLIYFRIIKQKVGFKLFPAALEGLARITHLINMETVEDLLSLMKNVLESSANLPTLVRLHCVYCALRTLSGPGTELEIDDEVFVAELRALIRDAELDFPRWDMLLECVELCLVHKRESRSLQVKGLVHSLLCRTALMPAEACAATLSLVHLVLLKYPTLRRGLKVFSNSSSSQQPHQQQEEEVADWAMAALQSGDRATAQAYDEDKDGDGSWAATLMKRHVDTRVRAVAVALLGSAMIPLPFRAVDAQVQSAERLSAQAVNSLQALSPTLHVKMHSQHVGKNKSDVSIGRGGGRAGNAGSKRSMKSAAPNGQRERKNKKQYKSRKERQ